MNEKVQLILKDLVINGISDSLAVLAYFSISGILRKEASLSIAENALKLGIILFSASITSSLYKNIIGERIEERSMRKLLAHLANIPITDLVVTLVVALIMKVFPPKETTKEVEKSIVATPFFLTLMANYTGRGVANVVNYARDNTGKKKRAILFLSTIVPILICNIIYVSKFNKDGKNAIAEISALTTVNLVSQILNYGWDKWVKSKEIDPVGENSPLIG